MADYKFYGGIYMQRKKKYQKKSFESTGINSDTSSNIYQSMMLSLAWSKLSKSQMVLYMYMKSQYYSQKKKPIQEIPESFYFNQSKWLDKYHLYSLSNKQGFYRDLKALIRYGFIDCLESGKTTKTKNIYKLSDRWQHYELGDENNVPVAVMNASMLVENSKKHNKM